jgi:hypothetical protein
LIFMVASCRMTRLLLIAMENRRIEAKAVWGASLCCFFRLGKYPVFVLESDTMN